jgi:DNA-binding transcriptional MerR regulator
MTIRIGKLISIGCLLAAVAVAQDAGALDAARDNATKAMEAAQKAQAKAQEKALKDREKSAEEIQAQLQEKLAAAQEGLTSGDEAQAQLQEKLAAVQENLARTQEDLQSRLEEQLAPLQDNFAFTGDTLAKAQAGLDLMAQAGYGTPFGQGVGSGIGQGYGSAQANSKTAQEARADAQCQRGQSALDQRRWDEALTDFTAAANGGGSRADGALYWKAYTLNRLGRRDEALAAIADLRKSYASSRWLEDAGALELEIKQSSGQPVSPDAQSDEDLKLMALNGLMATDSDKALTAVDGILKGAQSPRLKSQALFVLAQNSSPKAQQMLEQVARGSGNPDLQVKAIGYLAPGFGRKAARTGETTPPDHGPLLAEIYGSSNDVNVKRAVISALAASHDNDRLLQLAKAEKSADVRADIIRRLYSNSYVLMGGGMHLNEISDASANTIAQMYSTEQDKTVKRAIIDSFASHNQVKQLVAAAKTEKDPEMARYIVGRLSNMKSPEASDYLMEILKK